MAPRDPACGNARPGARRRGRAIRRAAAPAAAPARASAAGACGRRRRSPPPPTRAPWTVCGRRWGRPPARPCRRERPRGRSKRGRYNGSACIESVAWKRPPTPRALSRAIVTRRCRGSQARGRRPRDPARGAPVPGGGLVHANVATARRHGARQVGAAAAAPHVIRYPPPNLTRAAARARPPPPTDTPGALSVSWAEGANSAAAPRATRPPPPTAAGVRPETSTWHCPVVPTARGERRPQPAGTCGHAPLDRTLLP
ncbi:hypothetical protein BU14_1907s0001 [Porphyra umbilicalis]|uniref:Uncharacterized protein n=1 Tax=Porphyra umbilicalis TaxID=2786 RepID=A0A1X6NKD6_PORUM|nr:hypothetical protein BU14_1907s0001 [Porphyra umbilicalis]|eukprot:OSX69067.1 hypothetical protein BU14_1907s0001 [Porphyra umbilicalis]